MFFHSRYGYWFKAKKISTSLSERFFDNCSKYVNRSRKNIGNSFFHVLKLWIIFWKNQKSICKTSPKMAHSILWSVYAVSCRVVPCRAGPYRTVSGRAVPCRTLPCRALVFAVACRAMSCHVVICRAVPCCAVPCADKQTKKKTESFFLSCFPGWPKRIYHNVSNIGTLYKRFWFFG